MNPQQVHLAHHDAPKQSIGKIAAKVFGWSLLIAVSFVGSQFIVSAVIVALATLGLMGDVTTTLGMLIVRVVMYVAMAAMIAGWLWYRERKLRAADTGLKRLVQWRDIGLAITGFMAYFVLTTIAMLIASRLPWFNADQQQDLGISTHLFGTELLGAFIVLVVLTPLFEEIIFRGFLYGRLRKLRMPWWLPAVVVSVLFGLAHMQWNVGLDVFCLSMVACALREITGSIWSGVLVHMAKNFIAFMLTFVAIQGIVGG